MDGSTRLLNVSPSRKEEENGFSPQIINVGEKKELVMVSEKVNHFLRQNPDIKIRVNKNSIGKIRRHIKQHRRELIPFLNFKIRDSVSNGKTFVNEKKLCLSSDIDIKRNLVVCHEGTYFDSFLTNESMGKR